MDVNFLKKIRDLLDEYLIQIIKEKNEQEIKKIKESNKKPLNTAIALERLKKNPDIDIEKIDITPQGIKSFISRLFINKYGDPKEIQILNEDNKFLYDNYLNFDTSDIDGIKYLAKELADPKALKQIYKNLFIISDTFTIHNEIFRFDEVTAKDFLTSKYIKNSHVDNRILMTKEIYDEFSNLFYISFYDIKDNLVNINLKDFTKTLTNFIHQNRKEKIYVKITNEIYKILASFQPDKILSYVYGDEYKIIAAYRLKEIVNAVMYTPIENIDSLTPDVILEENGQFIKKQAFKILVNKNIIE